MRADVREKEERRKTRRKLEHVSGMHQIDEASPSLLSCARQNLLILIQDASREITMVSLQIQMPLGIGIA